MSGIVVAVVVRAGYMSGVVSKDIVWGRQYFFEFYLYKEVVEVLEGGFFFKPRMDSD
jgi:hypothetical protein